jgi:hypothetical protein
MRRVQCIRKDRVSPLLPEETACARPGSNASKCSTQSTRLTDFLIAVVEAKAAYRTAGDSLQQAKEYAQILGLKFAYATNGHSIIETAAGRNPGRRVGGVGPTSKDGRAAPED